MYTIYKATNKINGKSYIGFDSNWPRRKKHHEGAFGNCVLFSRAMKKYGKEAFEWNILYQSKEMEHTLKVMEPHFIEEYETFTEGYNLTKGGEGIVGLVHSYETKEKIREKALTRPVTEKKLQTLRKNALLMKKNGHTEKTKKKMSESQKSKDMSIMPESWWDSLKKPRSHMKYYQTEEYKKKMSEACKKPKHTGHGKAVSAGRTGFKWYHNPTTGDATACLPQNKPDGYISGRVKR